MCRLFTLLACSLLLNAPAILAQPTPPEIVGQERAKIQKPQLVAADIPPLLTTIATRLTREHGGKWGLLVKRSGNECGGYACDIICNEHDHFDVLKSSPTGPGGNPPNAPGPSEPWWHDAGPYSPRVCEFVTVAPPPGPGPTPDPWPAIDALIARLTTVEEQIASLRQQVMANEAILNSIIANFEQRITELERRPIPCSTGRLWGVFNVRVCPEPPRP